MVSLPSISSDPAGYVVANSTQCGSASAVRLLSMPVWPGGALRAQTRDYGNEPAIVRRPAGPRALLRVTHRVPGLPEGRRPEPCKSTFSPEAPPRAPTSAV